MTLIHLLLPIVILFPMHAAGSAVSKDPPSLPVGAPVAKLSELGPNLSIKKNSPLSAQPFWRQKASLMKRIREERAVIVSVKSEDIKDKKQVRFTMAGAGQVSRSKDSCFRIAQDFSKLKEVSDHFKTVSYDPSSKQLLLITEALGYQARMIMQIMPVTEDWRSELQWEVVWGHFKGMRGYMGFEEIAPGKTEVSVNALYEASELPLPKVLMGFALEIITQKVAEKMRTYIEAQP